MEEMDDPDDGIEPAPEADVGMLMADLSGIGIADTSSAEEWMKFNLDTGAAQTAIPNGWEDRVVVKATGLFSRLHQESWCPVRALEPLRGSTRAATNAV